MAEREEMEREEKEEMELKKRYEEEKIRQVSKTLFNSMMKLSF